MALDISKVKQGKIKLITPNSCEWHPGDGYRYIMITQEFPDVLLSTLGGSKECRLVTFFDGETYKTNLLIKDFLYTVDTITEKFQMYNNHRRFNFTALLNLLLGDFKYGEELLKLIDKG